MSDPIENGVDIPALVAGLRQFADALDDVESEPEEGKLIRRAAAALESLTAENERVREKLTRPLGPEFHDVEWWRRSASFWAGQDLKHENERDAAEARVSVLEETIREALDIRQNYDRVRRILVVGLTSAPTDTTGDESNE